MSKKLVAVAVIVAVIGAGALLYMQSSKQAGQPNNKNSTQTSHSAASTTPSETANTVTIRNFAFSPADITIKKGTTVTWTNQDDMDHNVIALDPSHTGGLPASASLLDKGESYKHTFTEVGVFKYRCQPHAGMTGTVEVVE